MAGIDTKALATAVQNGDTRPWIEALLRIRTKDNDLVPFRFNRLQETCHTKLTGRDYVVKYRQGGSSTYHLARGLAYACSIPYWNSACVTISTDRGRTKERMFQTVHRFLDEMDAEYRPIIGQERADAITFPMLDSQFYIGTAGSREFGRSETINFLHITELAAFKANEADAIFTAAIESVPTGGIIIIETTPRDVGSYAHNLWMRSVRRQVRFNPIFVPWYWAEDYHLPPSSPDALQADRGSIVLAAEERELAQKFLQDGVPVEDRIRWRRMKVAERRDDFFAEYPEDAVGCWLAATDSVFPVQALRTMLSDVRDPLEVKDALSVYKKAMPGRTYSCGIDGASGLPSGDFSAGVILCNQTGEHVATIHGHIPPQEFARCLAEAGNLYYRMTIGGERDAWTLQVVEELERLGYDALYRQLDGNETLRLGFPNTHTSRVQAIAVLREAIRAGDFRSPDGNLVQELMQYQRHVSEETRMEKFAAPQGLYDDLCVAAQRAQQIRQTVAYALPYAPEKQAELVGAYPGGLWR